ncbi:hypothetical protein [Sideroxydans sp. CL21]|uniref:hypothetical protein n=1 Tax=Sideroxydans sp. CL21 TaxID=2600596 RepID=UPI0012AA3107|nr:hypothetical protein [Sideroxydans sp. CL21]VVC82351.1 hypothetical protein [Sideroxydans sp. CL21]
MEWLFNLGVKSGFPRYVSFVCLIQASIVFVPESIWEGFGINAISYIQNLPNFVQHYVNEASFKNSMFVFWTLSPIAFSINFMLWFTHINYQGYAAYLQRRAARLETQGKTSDYSLIVGALIFTLAYVWYTGINLKQPSILGNFVPTKDRIAMFLVHCSAVSLILPLFISVLITEVRANLEHNKTVR